jgi:hypothetical protein
MSNGSEKTIESMDEKIDKAIGILLDQIRSNLKPNETLQQTQAVLNMAHAKHILLSEGKTTLKKSGAGAN